MKKEAKIKNMKLFLLIGIVLFLISGVSAQIIGGEVFSEGRVAPFWQNVFVYDIHNVNDYFKVSVSPNKNRYSFENSEIFGKNSILRAEILDFENGFMAGPVEMNLSLDNNAEYPGDDIFPKMEFREVIQLEQPPGKLVISEKKIFDVVFNIYDGCDFSIREKNSFRNLCENCSNYVNSFESNFGLNGFLFVVDCHTNSRFKGGSREINFSEESGKWVIFEKRISSINEGEFLINFDGTKSRGIFSITDFIPDEFEVFNISGGGVVYDEDGYYAIEWKNSYRSPFNFSYYIKPKKKVRSCEIGLSDGSVLRKSFEDKFNLKEGEEFDLKENDFYFDCNFSKDISVYVVEEVNFESSLKNKIKKNKKTKISLKGNISENVSGLEFREYVPVEFEISEISNNGYVEISSSSYNVIVWEVNGNSFDFSYSILSSVKGVFSFMSEIGGNILGESFVNVYARVPSRGRKKKREADVIYEYYPQNFSRVTNSLPLIDSYKNMTLAIYSKNFTEKGAAELFDLNFSSKIYNRSLKFFDGYLVETNLGNNFGKFAFEYDFNPKDLEIKGYRGVEFYGKNNRGNWISLTGNFIEVDGDMKYKFESEEFFREIIIFGVKEKLTFWDRFVEWSWRVFGFKGFSFFLVYIC